MRPLPVFLAITLLALFAGPAPSFATKVDETMANNYYQNCMAKPDPRLSDESQDALCSCTAAQMMKTMSVEDMRTMQENSQAGRDKLNYMLVNVYGPCMLYPVKDMVEASCNSDPKMENIEMTVSKTELCSCMARKTGEWYASVGTALIKKILKENPNIYDVTGPVMESKEFREQSFENLVDCVK